MFKVFSEKPLEIKYGDGHTKFFLMYSGSIYLVFLSSPTDRHCVINFLCDCVVSTVIVVELILSPFKKLLTVLKSTSEPLRYDKTPLTNP